jgi:hypothetical protein
MAHLLFVQETFKNPSWITVSLCTTTLPPSITKHGFKHDEHKGEKRANQSRKSDTLFFMRGFETATMSQPDFLAFRAAMLEQLRQISVFFTTILNEIAGDSADSYLPSVSAPKTDFCDDWLGFYSVISSGRLDNFLEASPKVQLASTTFPPVTLKINLFSEANHPGYRHDPRVVIEIEILDDPALHLFEMAVEATKDSLQAACEAASAYRVVSRENVFVQFESPDSIADAVKLGAEAIREKAKNRSLGHFALEIDLDARSSANTVTNVTFVTLSIFHSINHELGCGH